LLKFFEIEARFPRAGAEVPPAVVSYVAEQVKVGPALFASYRWSGRTIEYHRAQVRTAFGFREFAVSDENQLIGWLAEEMCPVELREDRLREAVLVRCRAGKLEPPTPGRIDRLVGSARSTFDQRFCARTVSRLSAASVQALNELVAETATPLALHLLQSSLVHINTLLLQRVLQDPEFRNLMGDNERRALSALFWFNINPYGRFLLDMNRRLDIARQAAW
jgi:hypothetical protein